MKRSELSILFLTALGAVLVSFTSFFYWWKYRSLYAAQEDLYRGAVDKVSSIKGLAPTDIDFLVLLVTRNHTNTRDMADMYWSFGLSISGLTLVIAVFSYKLFRRLKREQTELA